MNTPPSRTLAIGLAAFLCAACATAPRSDSSETAENRLTTTELLSANARTAYEAVERLRPQWLNSRGPVSVTDPSPTLPNVYMNGSRIGDIDYLRQVDVIDVGELRFWPPAEASARFGMGNPRGVIEIVAKR
jgi:hypothetical protein